MKNTMKKMVIWGVLAMGVMGLGGMPVAAAEKATSGAARATGSSEASKSEATGSGTGSGGEAKGATGSLSPLCSDDGVAKELKEQAGCFEERTAPNVVVNIINWVLGILAMVAVVVIIIAGVNYTTSAGDAGKVVKAKNMLIYAIVGLIVAALAFAIVNFVLGALPGE